MSYCYRGVDLAKVINELIDAKLSEKTIKIPEHQLNDAIVNFFTTKKWFLTQEGKKIDTYDLLRKFAMNTIGIADNGEIQPELLNVVRQEVAKIIAEVAVANTEEDVSAEDTAKEIEDAYDAGWEDAFEFIQLLLEEKNLCITEDAEGIYYIDSLPPDKEPVDELSKEERIRKATKKIEEYFKS